jgi:hypothetical protein
VPSIHPRQFRTIGIILDDYDLSILVLTGQIAECPAVRGLGILNIKRSNFDSTSIAIWRSSALLNALWRQRIK